MDRPAPASWVGEDCEHPFFLMHLLGNFPSPRTLPVILTLSYGGCLCVLLFCILETLDYSVGQLFSLD